MLHNQRFRKVLKAHPYMTSRPWGGGGGYQEICDSSISIEPYYQKSVGVSQIIENCVTSVMNASKNK
jgi:hypothetical protein